MALTYQIELWDCFELVTNKAREESDHLFDVVKYIKGRGAAEDTYAEALRKLEKNIREKKSFERLSREETTDEKRSMKLGWERVLDLTGKEAAWRLELAQQIEKQMSDFNVYAEEFKKKQQELEKAGKKLLKEQQDVIEDVERRRQQYHKASYEAEVAEKTLAARKADLTSTPKEVQKLEEEVVKKNQKGDHANEKYKRSIADGNKFQDDFHDELMPNLLEQFEQQELERGERMKALLQSMTNVLSLVGRRTENLLSSSKEMIASIFTRGQMDDFIRRNVTVNTRPDPFEYEEYEKGRDGVQDRGRSQLQKLARVIRPRAPALDPNKRVFGVPLQRLMELQREAKPHLDVPWVLELLMRQVQELGAVRTEGIFRVPGQMRDVERMKAELDAGREAIDTKDIHNICSLLKLFLRELPEALVPASLFQECLRAANSPKLCEETLVKVPDVNRRVLLRLLVFLRDLAVPDVIKITLMNADNLAMVFAPGILRNPSDNPADIMASCNDEKRFVLQLLEIASSEGGDLIIGGTPPVHEPAPTPGTPHAGGISSLAETLPRGNSPLPGPERKNPAGRPSSVYSAGPLPRKGPRPNGPPGTPEPESNTPPKTRTQSISGVPGPLVGGGGTSPATAPLDISTGSPRQSFPRAKPTPPPTQKDVGSELDQLSALEEGEMAAAEAEMMRKRAMSVEVSESTGTSDLGDENSTDGAGPRKTAKSRPESLAMPSGDAAHLSAPVCADTPPAPATPLSSASPDAAPATPTPATDGSAPDASDAPVADGVPAAPAEVAAPAPASEATVTPSDGDHVANGAANGTSDAGRDPEPAKTGKKDDGVGQAIEDLDNLMNEFNAL